MKRLSVTMFLLLAQKFLPIPENQTITQKEIIDIRIPYTDFDTHLKNMNYYPYDAYTLNVKRIKGLDETVSSEQKVECFSKEVTNLFKMLYEKNNPSIAPASDIHRIPRIIHQIWVGPKSREKYEHIRQTWLDKHPGWLYMLWTDEEVRQLELHNQRYYNSSTAYAQKADILRFEILYMFGGVYVDMDFECVKPLDFLVDRYAFFTGMHCANLLASAIIGSTPRNPILKHCILSVKRDAHLGVPYTAGPIHFTKSFYAAAHKVQGPVIALPPVYFYSAVRKKFTKHEADDEYIKPETFGMHHDAADWY